MKLIEAIQDHGERVGWCDVLEDTVRP